MPNKHSQFLFFTCDLGAVRTRKTKIYLKYSVAYISMRPLKGTHKKHYYRTQNKLELALKVTKIPPKPGHGHSINTDKPKQNSFSHLTMKCIEFSLQKSILDRILK